MIRTRLVPSTLLALLFGLLAVVAPGRAVILDDEDPVDLVLRDGTQVRLYREVEVSSTAKIPNRPLPNLEALAQRTVGDNPEKEAKALAVLQALGLKPKPSSAKKNPQAAVALAQPVLSRLSRAPRISRSYYYLPVNLHLSKRPDGTPEFLFLKFTTEEREDQGGVSGALMHFLMEWGLTKQQETELQNELKKKDPAGKLMGAVPMEPAEESGNFQIVSATLHDEGMATSLVTSGKAPLLPGGKAAVASRLTQHGAQLLAATFEETRSITDVSIALDFSYHTLTPSARGTITFDWEKLATERDILEAEYREQESDYVDVDCWWIFCGLDEETAVTHTYDEMRRHYQFLEEKKVVRLEWNELREDERINKVRDAFFDYFLKSMAEQVPPPPPPPGDEEQTMPSPQPEGDQYTYKFTREKITAKMERRFEVFSLEARFAVRRPHQLVGNLASWYDGVRDNPRCVASVNLNDPFFQHRDINFILDLDAREMFDEEINYVTVNVRKKRSEGHDFEDHVTFDSAYVDEHGIASSLTYARGEDTDPDLYEYRAQWSLRGGNVFPPAPQWVRGRWEGVTLAPPVVPRTIEVEGSLEDMLASNITRITVQVHYPKFGREIEENIHLSPQQGEALVARRIFMDRDARGYAYRVIVNHKSDGKLVLPWSARVGDDYIYASIPEELFEDGSSLKAAAKQAASELVDSAKQKVLDQFQELLDRGGAG
jgi:hypothetical protein